MASGLLKSEYKINPNHPIYHYVDGVKHERAEWKHTWENTDRIRLYKLSNVYNHPITNVGNNNALCFLKISR
jgi:hypothetical protein